VPEPRTRTASRAEAANAIERVDDYLANMESALGNGGWYSASSLAVRIVVSACDGVLAYMTGTRSSDPDHSAAGRLLRSALGARDTKALRHFEAVISKKNLIEYEQRRITERDAREFADHAKRFAAWARKASARDGR
jgi:hypothetical protein